MSPNNCGSRQSETYLRVYDKKAETKVFPEKMGINQIGGAKAAHALYDDRMVGTRLTVISVPNKRL